MEVTATVTIIIVDDTLEHLTVTGGVVVLAATSDIMKDAQQRKQPLY